MPFLVPFALGAVFGVAAKSQIDGGLNTVYKVAAVGGVYLAWKKWG